MTIKVGRKWLNYSQQILMWLNILNRIDKKNTILDFGTGPGWALFVGSYTGHNITGLDFEDATFSLMNMRKALGVQQKTILYSVKDDKVPFEDNKFDIILCKAVLDRGHSQMNKQRELNRILRKEGRILVAPKHHLKWLKNTSKENKGYLDFKTRDNVDKKLHLQMTIDAGNKLKKWDFI